MRPAWSCGLLTKAPSTTARSPISSDSPWTSPEFGHRTRARMPIEAREGMNLVAGRRAKRRGVHGHLPTAGVHQACRASRRYLFGTHRLRENLFALKPEQQDERRKQGHERDRGEPFEKPDQRRLSPLARTYRLTPGYVEANYAASMLEWARQTFDGRMAYSAVTTDTVATLLGRPPIKLED